MTTVPLYCRSAKYRAAWAESLSVAGPLRPQSVMRRGPSALKEVPARPMEASVTSPMRLRRDGSGTVKVKREGTGGTISSPRPSRNGRPLVAPPVVTTT